MTDKNLGPAWIEREVWLNACNDSLNPKDFTEFDWVGLEVEEFAKEKVNSLIKSAPNFVWNGKDKAIMTLKCKNLEQNIPSYGPLLKIHKDSLWPLILRPVVRGGNWISDPISKFLNKEIWIIIYKLEVKLNVKIILENSFDLVNYFENKRFTERPVFVTFDVAALYPSILKHQMFEALEWAGIVLGLREEFVSFLIDCIKTIQETAFLHFEKRYFRLNNGCTMGSSFAAPIANLVLFHYECNADSLINSSFVCFKRYQDDGFAISKAKISSLQKIKEITRKIYPKNINLTFTISNRLVNFLDLKIFTRMNEHRNFQIETSVFEKPFSTNNFINFRSNHPKYCFTGIIASQLCRFIMICKNEDDFNFQKTKFFNKLLEKDFPGALIRKTKKPSFCFRSIYLQNIFKTDLLLSLTK